jgi:hypothetical protein
LLTCFGASLIVAVFSLAVDSPWVQIYDSQFIRYSQQIWEQWWLSMQALVDPAQEGRLYIARYWNHAAIFPLRTSVLLILLTLLFIKGFTQARNPVIAALNFLGQHALSVYILHLLLLALVEISGIKPTTGWQTWLLIFALVGLSSLAILIMQRGAPRLRRTINNLDPDTEQS